MIVSASNMASAMFTTRQLNTANTKKTGSMEKLSSGYRINRAADDAANLCISEKMRSRIRGLDRGAKNVQDGVSWLQVADGAMNESYDMLHRVKELAVQAANDTNTESDREAITEEMQQLRQEMNRISDTTEFNTEPVFLEYYGKLDVEGKLDDVKIYNATFDDQTGDVTYGGMVFHGERIPWDDIDNTMVYTTPPPVVEQLFKGGDYIYHDPKTDSDLKIHCEDGAKVPEISRQISISADGRGINIDGTISAWKDLVDEDGVPYSEAGAHGGDWTLQYGSAKLIFTIGMDAQDASDMAKVINSTQTGPMIYKWSSNYAGTAEEKAVDADVSVTMKGDKKEQNKVQITSVLAQACSNQAAFVSNRSYTVHAGEYPPTTSTTPSYPPTGNRGIWLSDSSGTPIADSFRSWKSMGIDPWDNTDPNKAWDTGEGISQTITYEYKDIDQNTNPADDTGISFTFQLSDVTSEDSVIDGLDGMVIKPNQIITDYDIHADFQNPDPTKADRNILSVQTKSNVTVSYDQESAMGRNFDTQKDTLIANQRITYDSTQTPPTVTWTGTKNGAQPIEVSGTTDTQEAQVKEDVQRYLERFLADRLDIIKQNKLNGIVEVEPKTLDEVLGASNITTNGYFSDNFTLDASMPHSNRDVQEGETYHTAFINFSSITQASDLDKLNGTGFDTTCATCSNHYSIQFKNIVSDPTGDVNGCRYKKTQSGNNFTLEIDLTDLEQHGVSTGTDLAKKIVEIVSNDVMDFHYTQYAADGPILRVFDNRPTINERDATFYTVPYDKDSMKTYNFELKDTDPDGKDIMSLSYDYNFADVKKYLKIDTPATVGGDYVRLWDTQNNQESDKYCKKADAFGKEVVGADGRKVIYTGPSTAVKEYDLKTYFDDGTNQYDIDQNRDQAVAQAAEAYAKYAVKKMLTNTVASLQSNDYTKFTLSGDEKQNKAINTLFDNHFDIEDKGSGLLIKNSGREGDETVIPKFTINAGILRMSKASGMTREAAEKTLRNVDRGLKWLSSVRTTYGGYQNRLEHTYANNVNTEENTQAAESRIRDTDIAKEMVQYSTQNIIQQAGEAMLSQDVKASDWLLQLLQ